MTREYSRKIYHPEWVKECKEILDSYDFPITLRQLFYVLITRKFMKKTENRYNSLSKHVSQARRDGDIKWESIVDYTREVRDYREEYLSITQRIKKLEEKIAQPYTLPRHYGQKEINLFFLEKDSLKPFIEPFLYPNSILVIGKGQNSWSNSFDLSKIDMCNLNIHLYTLVDYDLSGVYIHNSFIDQLEEFNIEVIEIKNIAITEEQIDHFHLADLTNPDKKNEVQLQALDPKYLGDLIINTCDQKWDYDIDQKREDLQKNLNEYYRKKMNKIITQVMCKNE